MIRVVNLKNYKPQKGEVLVKIDRSNKILGNMFVMHSETERDDVCDKYDNWFQMQIANKNQVVLNELRRIYKIALHSNVALGCWCYPKRCHGLTIKTFLDQFMPKKEIENADNELIIVEGDLLKAKEGMIVHQVNNCGKMGAGLAKQIRTTYPEHYNDYINMYNSFLKENPENTQIKALLGKHIDTKCDNLIIRGIFAQDGYGRDKTYTSYEHLKICLQDIANSKVDTIYIPYELGCGLAGGDWRIVSKMILDILPNAIIVKLKK